MIIILCNFLLPSNAISIRLLPSDADDGQKAEVLANLENGLILSRVKSDPSVTGMM